MQSNCVMIGRLMISPPLAPLVYAVDHTMMFITQCYNERRDLEAKLLSIVCSDVEIQPVLQDISGEHLGRASNRAPNVRLDIHVCGFWENQQSAFFEVRLYLQNADSYRDLELQRIYRNPARE